MTAGEEGGGGGGLATRGIAGDPSFCTYFDIKVHNSAADWRARA